MHDDPTHFKACCFGMVPIHYLTTACVALLVGSDSSQRLMLTGSPCSNYEFLSRALPTMPLIPVLLVACYNMRRTLETPMKRMRFGLLPSQFIVGLRLPFLFLETNKPCRSLVFYFFNFISSLDKAACNISGFCCSQYK